MSNAIEKYNRFATALNKAKIESNVTDHPPGETIHLYAMNSLPKEKMKELEEHLEYCWHCGEILADAEEFQQVSADVDAGIVKVNVRMPSFEELKEMAFGKTTSPNVKSVWQPFAELLLEKIKAFLTPRPPVFSGFYDGDLEIVQITLTDGSVEEIGLDYDEDEKRLEVFSDNKILEGKTIRITDNNGDFVESVFKYRPLAMESKPIKAIFNEIKRKDAEKYTEIEIF